MAKRCLGCMDFFEEEFEVCPNCGYVVGQTVEEPIHLVPGTLLHGRYILGKVLGFGGFGATYIAWDKKLMQKVAIKEYLPSEFSTRIPGKMDVTVFSGDKSEQFNAGLVKFIEEAKHLAKFQNEPGIIKVFDTFEANKTAYIVMEYLEGETLSSYLKTNGTIEENLAISMLMPIMESLKTVHSEGLLHRDICPENIFLTKKGEVKLIDFGASRYATTSHSRSLTVIIKPGYSPEEQYRSRGDQGEHTDVYALSGTLYKMITGKTPPDAMERRAKYENKSKDILVEPHKLTKNISRAHEVAILNALNVRIEDRTENIETFIKELNADPPAKRRYGKIKKIDLYAWPLWLKIAVPTLMAGIVTFGILLASGVISFSRYTKKVVIPDGIAIAPDVEGMRKEDAIETFSLANLNAVISGNVESDYISPGKIMIQAPVGGAFLENNGSVQVLVSSGNGVIEPYNGISTVPYLMGATKEETLSRCKKAGLGEIEFVEVYDDNVAEGLVVSTSTDGGAEVPEGSPITIKISKGPEAFGMPNVVGLEEESAKSILNQSGLMISVEYEYSDEHPAGVVISQSVAADTPVKRSDRVSITVSASKNDDLFEVPSVVGQPQQDAENALKEKSFEVFVGQNFDATVPAGSVISQTPEGGSKQKKGIVVTIIVSKGAEPTPTPAPASPTPTPRPKATATPVPAATATPTPTPAPTARPEDTPTPTPIPTDTPTPTPIPIFRLTFDANGGTVSEKEREILENNAYGSLPSGTRDYYTFDGWYTAASGGSKVSSDTVITGNTTLYAHWTQNPVSDWILASNVPSDAQIVETKWTYSLTEYKTSTSSSMSGWTKYDTQTSYGSYGSWSSWSRTSVSSSDTRQVETRSVNDYKTVTYYKYWRYVNSNSTYMANAKGYNGCNTYQEIKLDHSLSPTTVIDLSDGSTLQLYGNYAGEYGTYLQRLWIYGGKTTEDVKTGSHTEYRYRDRSKTVTYYYKRTVNKEATSDPTGQSNVSNVKKYVKYRAK